MPTRIDMAKFAKFCKDTGFIFQSSEIYGGINGFWDYGPLGVELKKNIKDAWWQDMVRNPPPGPDGQEIRMVGLDCSIIMQHADKSGASKVLKKCTLPLTGTRCVHRLITEWGVWDFDYSKSRGGAGPVHMVLREIAPDITLDKLRASTAAEFVTDGEPKPMSF